MALDVEFLGSNVHGKELFARLCAGLGSEESHDEPARIETGALGEGIACNGGAKFRYGSQQNLGTKAALPLNRGLDEFRKLRRVSFRGAEDYVAALQVRLRMLEFQREVEVAEGFHFDFVVAADVDAAKHGNEDGHNEQSIA